MIRFANPLYFFLVVPVILAAALYLKGRIGREAALRFSSVELVRASGVGPVPARRFFQSLLRAAALIFFIIALARPQTGQGEREETRFVIDTMIVLDISGSMATLDFHPDNRLAAAKLEAKRFIEARQHDRMGLVVFAKHGITQCPLTTDRKALLTLLGQVEMGMLEDGTAIGVGLATAVTRLRESEAKSKVVVLLTDGVNNSGEIDPATAAKIAGEFGVRVYVIGMGKEGEALLPVTDPRFGTRLVPVETRIDEPAMDNIARETGGRYFRARDEKALRDIFSEIDRLEKTEIKVREYTRYEDHFALFLWAGLWALALELFIAHVVWRKVP